MRRIIAYGQSEFSRNFRRFGVKSHGVCAAMSAMYLLMRSRGMSYWDWIRSSNRGQSYVMRIQGGDKTPPQYMDEVQEILSRMTWVATTSPITVADLYHYLENRKKVLQRGSIQGNGDYVMFVVSTEAVEDARWWRAREAGGHAMAAKLSRPVRFMDPDDGEWEFSSIHELTRKFLPEHLRSKWHHRLDEATVELQWLDANPDEDRPPPKPKNPNKWTILPARQARPPRPITAPPQEHPANQPQESPQRPKHIPRPPGDLLQRGAFAQRVHAGRRQRQQ